MKRLSQGKKWLMAGSVLFFAFACQSNGNGGDCSPCNKMKKCAPSDKGESRPGRCRDRPCGENAAADLSEQKEESVAKAVEAEAPQAVEAETVKAAEPAAPAVETPAVAVETPAAPAVEAPAAEAPAAVAAAAPEAKAETPAVENAAQASEISAAQP